MHKEYTADEIKKMHGFDQITPADNPQLFDKITYQTVTKYVLKPMAHKYAATLLSGPSHKSYYYETKIYANAQNQWTTASDYQAGPIRYNTNTMVYSFTGKGPTGDVDNLVSQSLTDNTHLYIARHVRQEAPRSGKQG